LKYINNQFFDYYFFNLFLYYIIMNFISKFEKIIQNQKTEDIVLDDIVGDVLKISVQYALILLIILVLIYNFYLSYLVTK
jgi:hypothetical protein